VLFGSGRPLEPGRAVRACGSRVATGGCAMPSCSPPASGTRPPQQDPTRDAVADVVAVFHRQTWGRVLLGAPRRRGELACSL
jgi:hypothetical protein